MADAAVRASASRWRAAAFREAMTAYLIGRGFDVTQRDTSKPTNLGQMFADEASDIRGLPVALMTRVDVKLDLADAADRAVAAAKWDDKIAGATIQKRKGHGPGDQYLVMTADGLLSLLERTGL